MKKFLSALSLILILTTFLTACSTGNGSVTEAPQSQSSPESTTSHEVTTAAPTDTPKQTEAETKAPEPTVPKSLKILAIGNSFSTDSMQYLYQIAKSAGIEEIVLGNLYYAGCSLEQHLSFAIADTASYTYYKNTSGNWGSTSKYKIKDALLDEDWDYISLQQTSKTSGLESSYGKTLTTLVDYVRKHNTKATLIWNMTWAYQQDSTHASFPNYDKDQTKMYNMIVSCVKNCIEPEKRFSLVIPCGTSIQNARTSFIGDTLTRDGYHLDYNIGRFIAGLTWFAAITGVSVDKVSYNPSTTEITEDMMKVAREAVANAVAKPYEVTESKIKEGKLPEGKETISPSEILNPADFFEADKTAAAAQNIDLTKYEYFEWDYLENQYWYCTKNTSTTTPGSSAGTYKQNICTKEMFSIEDLPVGTVFILDSGWQYRLEIFPSKTEKYTGKRPGMTTDQVFVLTEAYLNGCKYVTWNIASNPKSDISARYAQAAVHLRVYVPKS